MKIIGHRGARGLKPENTIASFERAIELGVDMIELDARVTSDGITILSHDNRIDGAVVSATPMADLRITSLYDAILAVDRRVPIYIEIKPGVTPEPVFAVIAKFLSNGWQNEDFAIGSFSLPILQKAQSALPDIPRIVIEKWSAIRATRRARLVNTAYIAMLEYWLWGGVIKALARQGFVLYAFPPKHPSREALLTPLRLAGYCNNPRLAAKWKRHGLAGVITDFPDRFKK